MSGLHIKCLNEFSYFIFFYFFYLWMWNIFPRRNILEGIHQHFKLIIPNRCSHLIRGFFIYFIKLIEFFRHPIIDHLITSIIIHIHVPFIYFLLYNILSGGQKETPYIELFWNRFFLSRKWCRNLFTIC